MSDTTAQFPLFLEHVTAEAPSSVVLTYKAGTPSTAGIGYIQDAVGGTFDVAFTVPSPRGGSYEITGYVNDEGLLIPLPVRIAIKYPNGYVNLMAGNMLIQGLDSDTGESIPLAEEDISYLMARRSFHEVLPAQGYLFHNITLYDFSND